MKKVKKNQLKIIIFTPVENRCMLHEHVFVMCDLNFSLNFFQKCLSKHKDTEACNIKQ